jgi:hypothetical protein
MDNIKLYLRWMMSEPIGDTRFKVKVSTGKDTQLPAKHDPYTADHTAVSSPRVKMAAEQESTEAESMIT